MRGHAGDEALAGVRRCEQLRLLHVESAMSEENRTADPVPVLPAAEVPFLQARRGDEMVHDHVGQIETVDARRPRAEMPLALRLVAERAGFAPEPVVEQADPPEHVSAIRDVDAKRPRDVLAKLANRTAVVEQ